jgi:hypothetical protein
MSRRDEDKDIDISIKKGRKRCRQAKITSLLAFP